MVGKAGLGGGGRAGALANGDKAGWSGDEEAAAGNTAPLLASPLTQQRELGSHSQPSQQLHSLQLGHMPAQAVLDRGVHLQRRVGSSGGCVERPVGPCVQRGASWPPQSHITCRASKFLQTKRGQATEAGMAAGRPPGRSTGPPLRRNQTQTCCTSAAVT